MKVFIAGSTSKLSIQRKSDLQKIRDIFINNKHQVLQSWFIDAILGTHREISAKELHNYNMKLLKSADIVVIDPSTASLGVGVYFSEALTNRKHILVIYREDALNDTISDAITGTSSSLMTLKHYNNSNLKAVIEEFLENLHDESLQKFNFMANKLIVDWIARESRKENKTKSEFLRDKIINNIISQE